MGFVVLLVLWFLVSWVVVFVGVFVFGVLVVVDLCLRFCGLMSVVVVFVVLVRHSSSGLDLRV